MAKRKGLKALREQHKPPLSQTELAKRVGVGQWQISRMESDPRQLARASWVVIEKLAAALGVAPKELTS